jgi:hypothetical protein
MALLTWWSAAVPAAALLMNACHRGSTTPYAFESRPREVFSAEKIPGTRDPKLDISSSGMLSMLVVYEDAGKSRLGYAMSHDGGDSFMPLIPVSEPGAGVQSHGENSPTLTTLPTAIYAFWEQEGSQESDLMLARSLSYGQNFDKPVRVTDNETSFHGFSSVAAAPNGDVYAVWLDGRDGGPSSETFAVYLTRSKDRGATFEKNRRVALSACPCCRPRVAFGAYGEIYVAWRKVFSGDVRDMVVSTSRDDGRTFSPEVRVADDGWRLRGCPDSGPSLTQSGDRLYIAWLTEGRERRPRIQLAWSDDQGAHFHVPVAASSDSVDPNHPVLTSSEDGRVLLTFQARNKKADGTWEPSAIFASEVAGDRVSTPKALANGGAPASYPHAVAGTGGRVYVTWTQRTDGGTSAVLLRGRRDRVN